MLVNSTDQPKVLFFDIEATNLKADFGYILCCGFKYLGDKRSHVFDISQYPGKKTTDDSKLVEVIIKEINHADVIVTYYGRKFDVPFIQTRQLRNNRKDFIMLPDASHVDLWETAKRKLKLHNNRLASIIDFLDLDNEKTPLKGQQWIDAQAGYKHALNYVIKHCHKDVLALEEAYLILRPLIANHPRMSVAVDNMTGESDAGRWPCPNCGSYKNIAKGYAVTGTKLRKQRRKCHECGHCYFGRIDRINMEIVKQEASTT